VFPLLITNKVVGDDVTLQYWSWLAYSTMGFDTSCLTQDCNDISFFRIKTDYPIPMFQYGNSLNWAKFSYIILHPDLTCTVLSGLDKTYCKTVTTFLQTDMRGIMNFANAASPAGGDKFVSLINFSTGHVTLTKT
jgi:hypothetical protein